jgi:hypothetical protein
VSRDAFLSANHTSRASVRPQVKAAHLASLLAYVALLRFVVIKLAVMFSARGLIDERDPVSNQTPLLHWAGAGGTYNVMALMVDHGADMDAVDRQNNTVLHRLVSSRNYRALEPLAKLESGFLFKFRLWDWKNNDGLTVLQLSAAMQQEDSSRQIHRLLLAAYADWKDGIRPLMRRQLEVSIPVRDCANIVLEYLDGSGKPFQQHPQFEEEQKEEHAVGTVPSGAPVMPLDAAAAVAPLAAAPLADNPDAGGDELPLSDEEEDAEEELDEEELDEDLLEEEDAILVSD